MLKEAEAVVNSRPLVYIGDDIKPPLTLTPAHFLTLNPKIGIPILETDEDGEFNPDQNVADKLIKTWKKGMKLLDRFWQIWRNDYLLSLRERSQIKLKETRVKSPYSATKGDIVLIKDELPRGSWRIGRIVELVKSGDDEIRSAKVLLPSKKVLGRPLKLLYPIECPLENEEHIIDRNNKNSQGESKDNDKTMVRPKRQAAIRALDNIKRQMND